LSQELRATAPRLTAGSVTGDRHALRRSELLAAEFELGFTFQDKVELLLAA